jgi:hypothetical protein
MSQLKVDTITNEAGTGSPSLPNGLTVGGVNYPTTGPLSNRNKIINGAMVIDQRNAGAAVTPTNGQYAPDRWRAELTQASKYSVQQVADAPAGFVSSLKVTSLSAYSVTSSDQFNVRQAIEGFNVADLNYGTANAQSVTVSFWVKSSLTGTFGASLANSNNTMLYNFNYTINSADTWEYKTHTAVGPTTGTWQATNGAGIFLRFNLGLGSTFGSTTVGSWVSGTDLVGNPNATSVVATSGATFYITGVQLEAGTVATPFEHRSFGQELALCQRYFEVDTDNGSGSLFWSGNTTSGVVYYVAVPYKVTKRAVATVTVTDTLNNGFGATITPSSSSLAAFRAESTANQTDRSFFRGKWTASAEL